LDPARTEERCSACGAPFRCGRDDERCWCTDLQAITPVPGKACLCRACLEEEIRKLNQST